MATLWEERLEFPDNSEVHWSASTVMAVFMAASLVSAVFFGLGYSFGRGGTMKPVFTHAASATPTPASSTQKPTPSAGVHPALLAASEPTQVVHPTMLAKSVPQEVALSRSAAVPVSVHAAQPVIARKQLQVVPIAHAEKKVVQSAAVAHYMVQVGAVGDRKDAQRLVSQLRQRGFHAGIYSTKSDKFLHVQIGPFTNLQQAQAMRHHVLASGYRAILKHNS